MGQLSCTNLEKIRVHIYTPHKTIVVYASGKTHVHVYTLHTQNRNHHVATLRLCLLVISAKHISDLVLD